MFPVGVMLDRLLERGQQMAFRTTSVRNARARSLVQAGAPDQREIPADPTQRRRGR
jgi:hypothetical protein